MSEMALTQDEKASIIRFINKFKSERSFAPPIWLNDEDGLLTYIFELKWNECWDLMKCSHEIRLYLDDNYQGAKISEQKFGPHPDIDWRNLIDFARTQDHRSIKTYINKYGLGKILLAYWLIFALAQETMEIYTNRYPTIKASIYIFFAKDLEESAFSEELKNASETLLRYQVVKKAHSDWQSLTEREKLKLELIYHAFQSVIVHSLKGHSLESLLRKSIRGDRHLQYIPRRVDLKLKEEYRKKENRMDKNSSLDIFSDDSGLTTYKDLLVSDYGVDDITDVINNRELIHQCLQNMDILTEREKQVMSMRYPLNHDTLSYTCEETAKELGIKKQTVNEAEKNALNKLRKALQVIIS